MARASFQARMRTYAGRAKSTMDVRTGLPAALLPQNLAGPIQLVLEAPSNGAHEMGFLPAYWALERVRVITAGGAGTYSLTLPAYNGLALVTVVAAAASASSNAADAVIAAGLLASYGIDRPVVITTAGTVTGILRIGMFGFPLDDARSFDA